MNETERYLDRACRCVSGPVSLRQHLRKELKEHLEEAIEALVATGISQSEATQQAVESLGEPEVIREGLQSVYGQSVTSIFVDKAMDWREETMKSEWKWNFAAQTGLVLIIALAAGGIFSMLVWVVPVLCKIHDERGAQLPLDVQAVVNVSYQLAVYWYLWLIPLVVSLGLFERKCKSENKALIRTTIGVGASLALLSTAFWMAGVATISLVVLLN